MYTAILLNSDESKALKSSLGFLLEKDWQVYCHHVTLNMGPMSKGKNSTELLDEDVDIEFDAIGTTEFVFALRVSSMKTKDGTELVSTNKVPHITVAVNVLKGGKPVMSNDVRFWCPFGPKKLCGKVKQLG